MIPARLGSKRVPNKNLRMIDGKPLICYILDTVISSGKFKKDEIFINSESEIFESVARSRGVKFYKRDPALATDSATNDDFTFDFINQTGCDIVYQFLPTSPFLTVSDISRFVEKMGSGKIDTLVSVKSEKIECVFDGKPINFDKMSQTPPSQYLTPVNAYACGMMGWKTSNYLANMDKYKCGYHGGDGDIHFYTVSGFATVDVDNEEDFQLAEVIARAISKEAYAPQFYGETHSEVDVPSILLKDGVKNNNLHDEFIDYYTYVNTSERYLDEITKLYKDIEKMKKGNVLPEVNILDYNGDIKSSAEEFIGSKTFIYFWSQTQMNHYRRTIRRVEELKQQYPQYRFVGICIQPYTDMVSQAQNILNLDLSNQFSFKDFESSSKDWVLTFLNKTIVTDEKVKIIDGFSNLFTNDIEKILSSN